MRVSQRRDREPVALVEPAKRADDVLGAAQLVIEDLCELPLALRLVRSSALVSI